MSKHTPGPWKLIQRGGDSRHSVQAEVWAGSTCVVRQVNLGGVSFELEGQANARLIATAPEMLEALKYARNFMRGAGLDIEGTKLAEAMDAAISKAEGRE